MWLFAKVQVKFLVVKCVTLIYQMNELLKDYFLFETMTSNPSLNVRVWVFLSLE